MIQFSNYENFVDKSDITTLQSNLNTYSTNMDGLVANIDASFNNNNYNSGTDVVTSNDTALMDLDISNTIGGISASISNLGNYDLSMINIENKIEEYELEKDKLDNKLIHYNSIISKLNDGRVDYNYYLMLIWIIILFVVGYASFFSVIEEKSNINILSKIILFILLLFVGYFIFNNLHLYFSGYQINYTPLK